jgi:hypothetical protein
MPNIELIKDGNGQIIGSQRGDWIVGRDGKQVARFNAGTNQTISVKGQRYGTGDQRIGALKELGNKKK